jgi:hypothetical protein
MLLTPSEVPSKSQLNWRCCICKRLCFCLWQLELTRSLAGVSTALQLYDIMAWVQLHAPGVTTALVFLLRWSNCTHLGLVKVLSQFLPVCGRPSYLHSVSCSYVSCTHS